MGNLLGVAVGTAEVGIVGADVNGRTVGRKVGARVGEGVIGKTAEGLDVGTSVLGE